MKVFLLAVAVAVAMCAAFALLPAGTAYDALGSGAAPEVELARCDAGFFSGNRADAERRCRSLLEQLSESFQETPEALAQMALRAHGMLKGRGIDQPVIEMLEGLNLCAARQDRQRFEVVAGYYAAFRDRGMTHREAVDLTARGVSAGLLRELPR